MTSIVVSEVGPRDGLQSIKRIMPTQAKMRWIDALANAGVREIEVGSFVSAKLLPQLADTADVVTHALTLEGLGVLALVANLRGAQAAFVADVHKITIPVSVSAAHLWSNVHKTPAQMEDEVRAIVALRNAEFPDILIEAGLSTAFGCTISGPVPEDDVVRLAVTLAEMGVDALGLADTTGYANPAQVKRVFTRVRAAIGERAGSGHFHNTRGQGLANVLAALEVGVTAFDSSLGGIGGCPYAPGASGNIVTEDLVFMLEAMGLSTGIDLEQLIAARAVFMETMPGEPIYGHLADAGLPKGFRYADGRSARASSPHSTVAA